MGDRKRHAALAEIYADLRVGGYPFEAKSDAIAKKGLSQMLTKNSGVFHKLPNGRFGLLAWYPNVPKRNRKGEAGADTDSPDEELIEEPK